MLGAVSRQLRSHPALIPLALLTAGGGAMFFAFLGRTLIKSPDICWDKKDQEPWNKLAPNEQFKFHTVNMDYSNRKKNGPDF